MTRLRLRGTQHGRQRPPHHVRIVRPLAQQTSPDHVGPSDDELVALARLILARRRAREALFPEGLFSDPAWDMLLELFVVECEGQSISVSGLCYSAGVPATTALRWIRALEVQGIIVRRADRLDGRRSLLTLSPAGRGGLVKFLEDTIYALRKGGFEGRGALTMAGPGQDLSPRFE